jgi:hypothetical protein
MYSEVEKAMARQKVAIEVSKVLPEKLIVTYLLKKLPPLRKVHYHVQKIPPLGPILSQLNPVHKFTPCFLIFVSIARGLESTPRSSTWSLLFRPLSKVSYSFLISSCVLRVPTILSSLISSS